jgi:hypothetical protein
MLMGLYDRVFLGALLIAPPLRPQTLQGAIICFLTVLSQFPMFNDFATDICDIHPLISWASCFVSKLTLSGTPVEPTTGSVQWRVPSVAFHEASYLCPFLIIPAEISRTEAVEQVIEVRYKMLVAIPFKCRLPTELPCGFRVGST